jgi:hypothetical protein
MRMGGVREKVKRPVMLLWLKPGREMAAWTEGRDREKEGSGLLEFLPLFWR